MQQQQPQQHSMQSAIIATITEAEIIAPLAGSEILVLFPLIFGVFPEFNWHEESQIQDVNVVSEQHDDLQATQEMEPIDVEMVFAAQVVHAVLAKLAEYVPEGQNEHCEEFALLNDPELHLVHVELDVAPKDWE